MGKCAQHITQRPGKASFVILMNPLQQALTHFQQGNFDAALAAIKPLTDSKTKDSTTWFLSATIHSMIGNNDTAVKHYQKCIKFNPKYADAYNNLGVVYEEQKKHRDAEIAYRKALSLKPDYVSASFNLANILQKCGDYERAKNQYEKTLLLDPNHLKALNNLGSLLIDLKRSDKAQEVLLKAHEIHPQDTAILVNLGKIFLGKEENERAIELLQKAIQINPAQAEAYNNLGLAYKQIENYNKAIECLQHTLKINPKYAEAECNLGLIAQSQKKLDEAENHYLRAIELDPSFMISYGNLSDFYKKQQKIGDALSVLLQALNINDQNPEIHFYLAQIYLSQYDFANGWKHYVWGNRLSQPDYEIPKNVLPQSLSGKTITLYRDQGIGDELFLLRFAQELLGRGASVNYVSSEKLLPALSCLENIKVTSDQKTINKKGKQILISQLPFLLECNAIEQIPSPIELTPDQALVDNIATQLKAYGPGPYIGLTWRGGQDLRGKLFKQLPVEQLGFLMERYPDAYFVILQRNPAADEIAQLKGIVGENIIDMSALNEELDEMLALLSLLDNYITVSNTNTHLRASLGLHSDVFVPHPPEWRWGQSGKTSPWFPDIHIYRQNLDDSWDEAISEWKLAPPLP